MGGNGSTRSHIHIRNISCDCLARVYFDGGVEHEKNLAKFVVLYDSMGSCMACRPGCHEISKTPNIKCRPSRSGGRRITGFDVSVEVRSRFISARTCDALRRVTGGRLVDLTSAQTKVTNGGKYTPFASKSVGDLTRVHFYNSRRHDKMRIHVTPPRLTLQI
jgi:hypothetical protein